MKNLFSTPLFFWVICLLSSSLEAIQPRSFTVALSAVFTLIFMGATAAKAYYNINWFVCHWLIASTSFWWIINRILHGWTAVGGETQRDGVIWMIPMAVGWVLLLVPLNTEDIFAELVAIMLWTVLVNVLVIANRPEIDLSSFRPRYLEESGFVAAVKSLLKYQILVVETVNPQSWQEEKSVKERIRQTYRLSTGYITYSIGFAAVASGALISSYLLDRATSADAKTAISVIAAGFTIIAMFWAITQQGLNMTYSLGEDRVGWPMQPGERQIFAYLYILSSLNITFVLGWKVVLNWVFLLFTKP